MHKFSRKTCAFYQKRPSAAAEDSFLSSLMPPAPSRTSAASPVSPGICVGSTSGTPRFRHRHARVAPRHRRIHCRHIRIDRRLRRLADENDAVAALVAARRLISRREQRPVARVHIAVGLDHIAGIRRLLHLLLARRERVGLDELLLIGRRADELRHDLHIVVVGLGAEKGDLDVVLFILVKKSACTLMG